MSSLSLSIDVMRDDDNDDDDCTFLYYLLHFQLHFLISLWPHFLWRILKDETKGQINKIIFTLFSSTAKFNDLIYTDTAREICDLRRQSFTETKGILEEESLSNLKRRLPQNLNKQKTASNEHLGLCTHQCF